MRFEEETLDQISEAFNFEVGIKNEKPEECIVEYDYSEAIAYLERACIGHVTESPDIMALLWTDPVAFRSSYFLIHRKTGEVFWGQVGLEVKDLPQLLLFTYS